VPRVPAIRTRRFALHALVTGVLAGVVLSAVDGFAIGDAALRALAIVVVMYLSVGAHQWWERRSAQQQRDDVDRRDPQHHEAEDPPA
jgi:hypothetical protein